SSSRWACQLSSEIIAFAISGVTSLRSLHLPPSTCAHAAQAHASLLLLTSASPKVLILAGRQWGARDGVSVEQISAFSNGAVACTSECSGRAVPRLFRAGHGDRRGFDRRPAPRHTGHPRRAA